MANVFSYIKGDRTLWIIAVILALFSMMPVYSASSNIAFMYGGGNTFGMLAKHAIHLCLGLILMYGAHRMNYRHFGAISLMLLPIAILLLIYTQFSGEGVTTSNATRWIRIPFLGWTFQTSAFASVVLMLYLARQLAKKEVDDLRSFKKTFVPLMLPVFIICGLILPSNFSTAALIFVISMSLLFIGGYPLKNIFIVLGGGIATLGVFILLTMAFPKMSNRVDTWKARIENFNSENAEDNYQVNRAKTAIAEGRIFGKGPGKSVQKNFLPQSNSDFIYAVIVEEFGLIGGVLLVFFYILFLIRILIIATQAHSTFGRLAALGTGFMIMIQAFVNLGVAVNLLPVTGQTLPLISAGGSSIWMNCVAIGIILSISRGKQAAENDDFLNENEMTDVAA